MHQYRYNCIHGGGEYHGFVFDQDGNTVFEVHYPVCYYDEETGEQMEEETLFDAGIMKHTSDTDGLQNHLRSKGVIPADAVISMQADKGAVIESITGGVHEAVNPVVGYAYGGPTEWNIDLFDKGGEAKWEDAETGDSALVKAENKMGVIMKAYGRKFHLKFVDGTEKTYDANELTFFEDEEEMKDGGQSKNPRLSLFVKKFSDKYKENEDNNMHSENVVLLAERYGGKDDVRDARTILAKHNAIGYLTPELEQERNALNKKLYPRYQEELKEAKDKGYLGDGGKTDEKWIQGAIKKEGALRAEAKREGLIKGEEKLSKTDLKKLEAKGGKTAKRARLAMTLSKMKGGGKIKSFKEMTFKEKSATIQAKLKGSKVSPKYQKLYGKTYDSKEAKQAADAITGKIVSKMKE